MSAGDEVLSRLCEAHRQWPCRLCGTKHFEGCNCNFCREPDDLADIKREIAELRIELLKVMQRLLTYHNLS